MVLTNPQYTLDVGAFQCGRYEASYSIVLLESS
jgi:hypothetical protein